jgi:hypothetical protein
MHSPGLKAEISVMKIFFKEKVFKTPQGVINRFFIQLGFKFVILGLIEGAGVDGGTTPDIKRHMTAVKPVFLHRSFQPLERIGCFSFQQLLPGFFIRSLISFVLGNCMGRQKQHQKQYG